MNALSVFHCNDAVDGERYLHGAPAERCYSKKHAVFMMLGVVATLVYVAGVPLFFLFVFQRLRLWEALQQKRYSEVASDVTIRAPSG